MPPESLAEHRRLIRPETAVPVSQIWALMVLLSHLMLLVANSTPMVDLLSRLNWFRVNRDSRLLLPTPESPISTTGLKRGTNEQNNGPIQLHRNNFSNSLHSIMLDRQ